MLSSAAWWCFFVMYIVWAVFTIVVWFLQSGPYPLAALGLGISAFFLSNCFTIGIGHYLLGVIKALENRVAELEKGMGGQEIGVR